MGKSNNPQLERERAVYSYLDALESGDIDGIIASLQQAVYDAPLDQMLDDAHQAYFQEEQAQQDELAEIEDQTTVSIPVMPLSPQIKRHKQKPRHRAPMWLQTLAAVLIVGVLIGSFMALLAVRRATGTANPTAHSALLACTTGSWSSQVNSQQQGGMNKIAAISPTDAWAVGTLTSVNGEHRNGGLIEHWNGKQWTVSLITPNSALLNGVAAISANDVWAVGARLDQGPQTTLIEHWDGQKWSIVPSPNSLPIANANNTLEAITAISANDIWAVGVTQGYQPSYQTWTLIEHWDGQSWKLVTDQGNQFQHGFLWSVSAASANDVWMAGFGYVPKNNSFSSSLSGSLGSLLEHWNGQNWQATPISPGITITGISALSSNDVWAIGDNQDAQGHTYVSLARWNGSKWQSVPGGGPDYDPAQTRLGQIVAVNDNDVWLAGTSGKQAFVAQWDGHGWQMFPFPQPLSGSSVMNGLAVSGNAVWAVGDSAQQTLFAQQFTCH